MKRIVPLLFVFALVLIAVPDAQANHCVRCEFGDPSFTCIDQRRVGWTECFIDENHLCHNAGVQCTDNPNAAPLASEYTVAVVERLDEPATTPAETQIASTDAVQQPIAGR
jgi:hypothetical protein